MCALLNVLLSLCVCSCVCAVQSNSEPAYSVHTPRLGRSIDFQQLLEGHGAGRGVSAEESAGGQFVSRMMKKSVPFKPRLGKRAQVCGGGGGSGD